MHHLEEELFAVFPEAKIAYAQGKEWEYEPETVDCMNPTPQFDSDSNDWYMMYYGSGFAINEDGIYRTSVSCDTDGSWDIDYDKKLKECTHIFPDDTSYQMEMYRQYYEWVIENKRDPLNNFYVSTENKVTENITVNVEIKKDLLGNLKQLKVQAIATENENALERVNDYMLCDKDGLISSDIIIADLLRVDENQCFVEYQDYLIGHVKVTYGDPNPTYEAELIQAAQKALERIDE